MRLVIGGDFVPTKKNIKEFIDGNGTTLFGEELEELFSKSDFNIFNLETPLADSVTPIQKCGPNLIAPTDCINGYTAANANLLCLANNHILDQGAVGLYSTIKAVNDAGISIVGVGHNISEASRPFIIRSNDLTIGVYACAEIEFSIATNKTPGANPFDSLESLDHISSLKKQCDYVIVLYHGGKEYYRYPSPLLQKRCRKMIEKGANLVICQHSHCIGCYEAYLGGQIVYGQGNFLFDHGDNEYRNTGLLVIVDITTFGHSIEYCPVIKQGEYVRMADEKSKNEILSSFEERSAHIEDDEYLMVQYSSFAKKKINGYLGASLGKTGSSFLGRAINYISRRTIWKHLFSRKNLLAIQNYIECEAHRELFIQGIKEELKK